MSILTYDEFIVMKTKLKNYLNRQVRYQAMILNAKKGAIENTKKRKIQPA